MKNPNEYKLLLDKIYSLNFLSCINFKVPPFSSHNNYPFFIPTFNINHATNEPTTRMICFANLLKKNHLSLFCNSILFYVNIPLFIIIRDQKYMNLRIHTFLYAPL